MKNILKNIPENIDEEIFEKIISADKIRIERIISKGHKTKVGEWYDQEENEFVLLLKGVAELLFEDERVVMKEGDYIIIPAHKKHRVEKTSFKEETIWLAVFYKK